LRLGYSRHILPFSLDLSTQIRRPRQLSGTCETNGGNDSRWTLRKIPLRTSSPTIQRFIAKPYVNQANNSTYLDPTPITMQYYDTALEHLSTIDLESFRSILPETIHPFVLLSYPIRSEREAGGNSSASSRYLQQDADAGRHGSGSRSGSGVRNGDAQRVFVDGHGNGYGVGPSSATAGSYRSAATDSSSSLDCQPRPPYTSYYNAPSSSSTSIPASSYNHNLPLCEPLTIPHPTTHP
jgi:hypothetical protein